ncbi:hypothetical protein PR202_ga18805 [Eleusine coracana subsp. coracana]|uniref:RING-type E3 ubiquitin transferase n=1 Tax=Eleusine coracana subsp. coracana TaxID=191504 RepID=A0AAV5CTS6_ELECO|nr:hypothetical protein PR202_ga18805 [Eleusine coracana subsp. coracana]
MQGQRNSVEHFADVFGLEMGSSSGNPVVDQQAYWNNVLGSVELQNHRGYQMNHSDATIPYGNDAQQDGEFLGFWESGEASSSGNALNYGRSNVKTEHLNISGGLRIGERRLVAENNLSLDVDINLSGNANNPYGQSSTVNHAAQGPDNYGGCDHNGTNSQPTDLRLHPYRAFLYGAEQTDPFSSSNASENTLGEFSLMPEGMDPRPGSSLDGRRLACKRKNIEGANGQSSAGASTNVPQRNDFSFQNIASSSYNAAPVRNLSSQNRLSVPSSIEDQLPLYGTYAGTSSSSYDSSGGINNAGNAQRSFRPRTTTAQQVAPCSVWPSSNTIRFSNSWNIQAPHLQSTFDEPQEVIPVVSSLNLHQHPINVVPGVPQAANHFIGHRASSSRAGSLDNRILGSEEITRRNVVPTSFSDLLPPVSVEMRRLVPEPSNWSTDGRGTTISGHIPPVSRATISGHIPPVSRANTNSTANLPAGFTQQNLNRRHPRNLSEEIGRLSGAVRAHQSPRLRSGYLLEREGEGVWGVPLSMRSREGRRLMEIRNALQMIHRGENIRLEIYFLHILYLSVHEQSIFYGGVDIQDRHREMRLDIDNMSYEEEYVDGDDLGRLDCGHDFHAGCIKQWLVLKNLCPICKNTALKT